MPRAFRWVLLAVVWCSSGLRAEDKELAPATSADLTIKSIVAEATERSQVMMHLDTLVNRIGPRLSGSDGLYNAVQWAKGEFERFGLKNVVIEEAGEFKVGFTRGPWFGRMVEPVPVALDFNTPAWSAGTRGRVRAPARLAPETVEDIETARDQLKNCFVLLPTPRANFRQNDNRVTELRARLEEIPVAGIITAARGALLTTGGRNRPESFERLPLVPQIRLSADHWKLVEERLRNNESVQLEFDIRNYFKPGPVKYHNVIADLPGSDKPDEFVIIGGHIDSWDGATGTLDNGTGVATTMEVARVLATSGVRPRRTIRFMLWGGEEQGLLGSRAWIKAHPDQLPKISGVFVHDGGTNFVSGVKSTPAMLNDMNVAMAAALALSTEEFPFRVQEVNGLPRGIGSDHDSFLSAGVPGFFWEQSGRSDYNFSHHTQNDTFDQAIPEYQRRSATVISLAALGVANLDHLLSREKLTAPPRRRMGVSLEVCKVESVFEGAAEKAGIKVGDVFLSVEGRAVTSSEEITQALQGEGTKRVVRVRRGEETIELTLEWPEPPPEPAQPREPANN